MLWPIFFAEDPQAPLESHRRMHKVLMDQLFADIDRGLVRYLSHKGQYADVCQYRRVGSAGNSSEFFHAMCTDGVMKSFRVANFREQGNYRYNCLPRDCTTLEILNCDQLYELNTRWLPAKATRITLSTNVIYGTIDLTCLPEPLHTFNVSHNVISGPITLTHLPRDLEWLDLRSNKIKQHNVPYKNLPKNIHRINMLENKVRRIRNVDETPSEDQNRLKYIFHGMDVE